MRVYFSKFNTIIVEEKTLGHKISITGKYKKNHSISVISGMHFFCNCANLCIVIKIFGNTIVCIFINVFCNVN